MRLEAEAMPHAVTIAEAVRRAGGRAFVVGGTVRDRLLRRMRGEGPPDDHDLDFESYDLGLPALAAALAPLGAVSAEGRRYGVLKLRLPGDGPDVAVGLPRRDRKAGAGHRAFVVETDPRMPPSDAARRRDFTINALLWDPLTAEILDPVAGLPDLESGTLRAVDPRSFPEDSLRVLRGIQFAGRLEFTMDAATAALCRAVDPGDLSRDRQWSEFSKLLLLSRRPSLGLRLAFDLDVLPRLLPELAALAGCPQPPQWHPEGDVWTHTLQVVDVAAAHRDDLDPPRRAALMLAALLHDVGKPLTTAVEGDRLRAIDHENAGLAPAAAVLDRWNVHRIEGFDVRGAVLALIADHLKPMQLHRDRAGAAAIRRLAARCDPELLYRLSLADQLGRRVPGGPEPDASAAAWFRERVQSLGPAPAAGLVNGARLIELGVPRGPLVGRILAEIRRLEEEGVVETTAHAEDAALRLLRESPTTRDG